MAEAQRLAGEGLRDEALAKTDEALCEVLEPPPGYEPGPQYIEYLAEIINEADDIQASLEPIDNGFDVDEDLVILPPIDIVADVSVAEEEAIEEDGLPSSDFPLVLNPTVDRFLAAMKSTGEYHQRISVGLSRAGTYLPMIRSRFAAAGLPMDLGYLPLIESAFSIKAYSRARAHGMWQFISSTGRSYGLEVGSLVDERRDPVLSTEAAVAYLGDLYRRVQRLVSGARRVQLRLWQCPAGDPPFRQPGLLGSAPQPSPRNAELRPGLHRVGDRRKEPAEVWFPATGRQGVELRFDRRSRRSRPAVHGFEIRNFPRGIAGTQPRHPARSDSGKRDHACFACRSARLRPPRRFSIRTPDPTGRRG